jgi:hypothetical protein
MGPPGSGKTDSLTTLIEAGLELFVVVTEPDGVASLIDSLERRKLPMDKLHWATVLPAPQGWRSLKDLADLVGSSSFADLKAEKSIKGKEHTRAPGLRLLNIFDDFVDDRTGQHYGDVAKWGTDRAIVLDSLSGLNLIAFMLTVGHKSNPQQGEWGVAMNFIEQILLKLTGDCGCYLVITGHPEREQDEVEGRTVTMISTLGKKLAPRVTRWFSEIVMAKRKLEDNKAKFTWSTLDPTADLKNRALPLSSAIEPSFVPIVKAYSRRLDAAGLSPSTAAPHAAAATGSPSVTQLKPHLSKEEKR